MKLVFFALLLSCAVALVAAQWSVTDQEIFDIQAALEKDEGPGTTFYSIMNITKSATAAEIRKAYRARSMELHPDKHPNNPSASRRFERLGVIIKVLRDERKDRYDHFLANGFPRWRGSGYYYVRFRPGLGSVAVFLILVTSAIQLLVKHLNYTRDRKRLENLQTSAKLLAWGPRFRSIEAGLRNDNLATYNKNIIVSSEKKVRVPLSGFDLSPLASKAEGEDEKEYWDNDEKLIRKEMAKSASTGSECEGPRRFLEALVTKEVVFVMDPSSKEWIPLDENAAPKPTARDTWPFALVDLLAAKVGLGHREAPVAVASDEADTATVASSSATKKKNKKRQ